MKISVFMPMLALQTETNNDSISATKYFFFLNTHTLLNIRSIISAPSLVLMRYKL